MPLSEYRRKRRAESLKPRRRLRRRRRAGRRAPSFVIQHHEAHYDLRLEIRGVLVSWAIANGPSANPRDRRMARRTEDHPLFPEDERGAGPAIVWDRGSYANATERAMAECLDRGHLSFRLEGEKLCGGFTLTRIRAGRDETWLMIRRQDEGAAAGRKPVTSQPESAPPDREPDDLAESS
ncbi:DNA ligase [Mycobacterium florentinum]|uniref:DNA ligase n=1 Tax=Mycobacterium florentinum TaxID=292462 RepID=A0A1X1TW96_MYCFL|nr:DNA polymerase ligase N-terminal domain-containing protein [Mycobacterium florentinum]MCV7413586.1 DNA ligase [Mycobacterium florentinum]ORV48827.1 DNA ligase [Mycobacterium florentinum]BBX77175.1 hypothetical protein MFLOJ_09620 [Mycobacterium florentinum]